MGGWWKPNLLYGSGLNPWVLSFLSWSWPSPNPHLTWTWAWQFVKKGSIRFKTEECAISRLLRHDKTLLLLWDLDDVRVVSCDGVSGCNILTHQPPPGCAISPRLTIRPPPSLLSHFLSCSSGSLTQDRWWSSWLGHPVWPLWAMLLTPITRDQTPVMVLCALLRE